MAKASGGARYAPLSPKPERKPMSHSLFTNLLGQALGRQGLDPLLAPAIVADLMAITPPSSLVPESFDIHGVELHWPVGREARVLYPDELRQLNRALARNNNPTIQEEDGIVRVARTAYEALWSKRKQPDYVSSMSTSKPEPTRSALSDTLTEALASAPAPVVEGEAHVHHWVRSPGDIQDHCACGDSQQSNKSAIAGMTSQPVAPTPKLDARPNPAPVFLHYFDEDELHVGDTALCGFVSTYNVNPPKGTKKCPECKTAKRKSAQVEHAIPSDPLADALARLAATVASKSLEGSTK